ncbi:hypothetical protein EGW08_009664 [Elysia chlorotica]|uniref:UPAR/Ly6 domain-containing protein n=1 Tax=Elysia chlorotica TaxID=188477 RepID=A0A3S1BFN4_ELYCH|nr:hypothetical protein EGW08_009664 [Elysia chlorotica]
MPNLRLTQHQKDLANIWMLALLVTSVQTLECYSCVTSHGPDCLSSSTVTCPAGQVCSNTVYRRGYSLGLLYTKGCEDELQCVRLANLNSAAYCDHAPSQCQYCCSGDLCNGAATPPSVSGNFKIRHWLTMTGCLLFGTFALSSMR